MRSCLFGLGVALVVVLGGGCTSAPAVSAPAAPAASAPAAAPAAAQPPGEVKVGLIGPQAGYWAVYAADALGYFTRENVVDDITYTRSPATSAQMLTTDDVNLTIGTADTSAL